MTKAYEVVDKDRLPEIAGDENKDENNAKDPL